MGADRRARLHAPRPVGQGVWHRRVPGPGQHVGPEPYENGAWRYPPKSYSRWSELCQAFVTDLVERYGVRRVERWRFEVWNEPDIPYYWRGSVEEYCQLYEASRAGVRLALPGGQVGGPATTEAGTEFLRQVLARVEPAGLRVLPHQGRVLLSAAALQPVRPRAARVAVPGKMIGDVRSNVAIIQERYPDVPILVDECDPAVGTPYGVFDTPNFVVVNTTHYPTMVRDARRGAARASAPSSGSPPGRSTWRASAGSRAIARSSPTRTSSSRSWTASACSSASATHRVDARADGVGVLAGDRRRDRLPPRGRLVGGGDAARHPHLRRGRARRSLLAARQQPCPVARDGRAGRSVGRPGRPAPPGERAEGARARAHRGRSILSTASTCPVHEAILCEVVD